MECWLWCVSPGKKRRRGGWLWVCFCWPGKEERGRRKVWFFYEGPKRAGERKVWLCFYGGPLEGRRDGDGGLNCGGESLIFEKKQGRKKREKMLCWS